MAGAGKIHDGTPGRDGSGNHQLEAEEEKEGEGMGDEVTGNDRRDASVRRNPNTDREREWRRGFEQFEPNTAKSTRKKDMPRILTEKSGQAPQQVW